MNRPNAATLDARNLVDEDAAVEDLIRDDYEFLTEALGFDPFADASEVEEADLEEVSVCDALIGAERRWLGAHAVEQGDECRVDEILARTV